jgi:tetratricopeptide (TPR) repeat protein
MAHTIRPITGQKRFFPEEGNIPQPKKKGKYDSYPNLPEERPTLTLPVHRGPVLGSYYKGVSFIPPDLSFALNPKNPTISQQQEEVRSLREKVSQLEAQVNSLVADKQNESSQTQTKITEVQQRNFPQSSKDEQQLSPGTVQRPAQNLSPDEDSEEEKDGLQSDEDLPLLPTQTSATVILTSIAQQYQQNKEYRKATDYWREVSEDDGSFGRAQFNVGICFVKQNQLGKALKQFEKVPSSDVVYYGKAQFNMGMCYQKLWEYEKAIRYYRKVPCTNECLFFLAQYHLGICHERLDKIPEAIVYFSSVPLSHPKKTHADLHLGICYAKRDEVLLARSHWNLVTDSKLYEKAQFNIGVDYEKKENLPLIAIDHYMKVTKIDPKLYDAARFRMGLCHYRNNQFEQAKSNFSDVSESYERYSEAQDYINKIINKIITGNHS